jgi:hypothetical protein
VLVTPPARAALDAGSRPLRAVRSLAAALVCVTAAAAGHHAAGGVLAPSAVAAVFAGAAAVAWSLSARRVVPTQLVGLLVLCQVGVHLGASPGEMTMGAAMIGAHVAATALSVVVLAHGERFVWQLAEKFGLRLLPLLRPAVTVPSPRPALSVVAPRSLRDVRLAHSRSLRGPPVSPV